MQSTLSDFLEGIHEHSPYGKSFDKTIYKVAPPETLREMKGFNSFRDTKIDKLATRLVHIYTLEKAAVNVEVSRYKREKIRQRIEEILKQESINFFKTMDQQMFLDLVNRLTLEDINMRDCMITIIRQKEVELPWSRLHKRVITTLFILMILLLLLFFVMPFGLRSYCTRY